MIEFELSVYSTLCHTNLLHAVTVVSPVVLLLMVKFKVTTESQPAALVVVYVAVLFDAVYSVPCHVYVSQAV